MQKVQSEEDAKWLQQEEENLVCVPAELQLTDCWQYYCYFLFIIKHIQYTIYANKTVYNKYDKYR